MRSIQILTITLLAVLVGLSACDDPNYPDAEGERGTLSLSNFALTAVDTTITAGQTTSIDVSQFVVNVRNSNTGEIAASWVYSEQPGQISLLEGTYTVEAYNTEVQAAAWDEPYYYSSAQVRIFGREEASISPLQCTLANVKVSVSYSDELRAAMGDDVTVEVTAAQGASLEFTPGEQRSGFFELASGSSTLAARLTGTVGGVETISYQMVTGVTAGQHCRIIFTLEND